MVNPVKKKILFVAANPGNTTESRLDEEVREIREGLARSKWRDRFDIIPRWAVDADGLRRALLDVNPQIVHFSGHGLGTDGLMLSDETGGAVLVSGEALANLFELFVPQVECVLLNACYAERQAKAIYQHVDCVIGMNQAVGDRTAMKFAVGFYDALGAGRPYDNAYKFGCSAIDFEDVVQRLTPVLMARKSSAVAKSEIIESEATGTEAESKSIVEESQQTMPNVTGPNATGVVLSS